MGWLSDLLKEYPALSVAKERLLLAEERFAELEKRNDELETENGDLKAKIQKLELELAELRPAGAVQGSPEIDILLVHLFKNPNDHARHLDAIAGALGVDREMARYYIDKLEKGGLVRITHGNYVKGHTYYGLTSDGRTHVVESGLV